MLVYGPVASWRLGNSLGIDLIEPPKGYAKICSYDCVYCQLGLGVKTKEPVKSHFDEESFKRLAERIRETKPDVITFSGRGEPTLNPHLGYIARRIKQITDVPVAVLTNASLIYKKEIRKNLEECDFVIAKIDAPDQNLFERINNPSRGVRLNRIIKGIQKLKTRVAIQTLMFRYESCCEMLTNAGHKTVDSLSETYARINNNKKGAKPVKIFLGTAYRPCNKRGVKPISEKKLKEIAAKISCKSGTEVVYYKKAKTKSVIRKLSSEKLKEEVLELLKRRPCTFKELSTRFKGASISKILERLASKNVIKKIRSRKEIFYSLNTI